MLAQFDNHEFNNINDLVSVAVAYLNNADTLELSSGFFEKLELALLNRVTSMSVRHVLELAPAMVDLGSTEIYECFDRIIGDKIDELTVSEMLTAFLSFKMTKKAEVRSKVVNLLLKKLKHNLALLSVEELSCLALVLRHD